jgi:hypothetical protein
MSNAKPLKSILMIEPCSFGFNEETAANNYFQQKIKIENIQGKALAEFKAFVDKLRLHGIDIQVVKDTPEPLTPDSIFPNNWISFHEEGKIVLYPMFAVNRRAERKPTVLDAVHKIISVKETIDLTYFEEIGLYLEGTGSMVLDRENKIAYACLSGRTDTEVLEAFCSALGYEAIWFHAADRDGHEIYHTNVMMCIGDQFAVLCLDAVPNDDERERLVGSIVASGKTIVEIDFTQMEHFCGNMLQVNNTNGEKFIVMSTQAYNHLRADQIIMLESFNAIIHSSLDTIESIGGGSARCMLAEVY